ncbi:MAG: Stp1/IreP family PP2C-type Ser/Thr phosphatase [Myxococcales bacterium]|nr:Stp1/IreP family PP2C-type Ser/Thr phosphatase [Myxococcota bacterium]MDW8280882.1 Stp1/IreP family PP2C-type Ser/Thr phosphatase [Myxococcales bacterium]
MLHIQFYAATDVGRQRDHNEDNFLVDPKLNLFVVADGMGGHAAGEVASQIAVHTLSQVIRENIDVIEKHQDHPDDPSARQEILAILEHAIQTASSEIFHRAQEEQDKRGMGTTCSALLIVGGRGFIAHVGDTRIYLLRHGQVHQITEDHSLLNELVRRGKIKREELENSPYAKYKNAVTRAVGAYETVESDTIDFEVLPGDLFLLCSDGMHAYLKEGDLQEILSAPDLSESPKTLVALANAGGGHDNITVVVVRIEAADPALYAARASELANKVEVLKGMPLFKYLSYKEIMRLLNITLVREFKAGEQIIREKEPGEELFVILSGRVTLQKEGAFLTQLGRGAHFGEMALVDRSPRSASAWADEPTRVLTLRRRDFYEIIRKEAPLAVKLLWSFVQVLTERLRKTTEELSAGRIEQSMLDVDLIEEVTFEE